MDNEFLSTQTTHRLDGGLRVEQTIHAPISSDQFAGVGSIEFMPLADAGLLISVSECRRAARQMAGSATSLRQGTITLHSPAVHALQALLASLFAGSPLGRPLSEIPPVADQLVELTDDASLARLTIYEGRHQPSWRAGARGVASLQVLAARRRLWADFWLTESDVDSLEQHTTSMLLWEDASRLLLQMLGEVLDVGAK